MGNRPVPTKLRILRGNPGGRPINDQEPEPIRGIPRIPKWLRKYPIAIKEFKREAKLLDQMGLLTVADAGALAIRAYLASQIQTLADKRGDGKHTQIKGLIVEYRQYGSLLGLDPSSRVGLKVEKKPAKSKAEMFRDRKNSSRSGKY